MINVNLLPWRENIRKLNQIRLSLLAIVAGFGVLIISLLIYLLFQMQINQYKNRYEYALQIVKGEEAQFVVSQHSIKDYQASEAKLRQLFALKEENFKVINLLNHIKEIPTDQVTITGIKKMRNQIILSGKAKSETDITALVRAISDLKKYGQPTLKYNNENTNTATQFNSFELTFELG